MRSWEACWVSWDSTDDMFALAVVILMTALLHSEETLFPNKHLWSLLLFFWLKWAGYLAVAGLNLLAQISDRISPYGV